MENNSILEFISKFRLQENAPTGWEDFAQKATKMINQIDDMYGFTFLEQPGNMLKFAGYLRDPNAIWTGNKSFSLEEDIWETTP